VSPRSGAACLSKPPTPHPDAESAPQRAKPNREGQKTEVPCVTFAAVARAIGPFDAERTDVMARFKASGGRPDAWHERTTREAMLCALVAVEDRADLESRGRMTAARLAMRGVRRRLELDLWP
jgi:hypothetical protein